MLQRGAHTVAEDAKKVMQTASFWQKVGKIFGLLNDKHQKILVMGCTGVGKTRFITSLLNKPTAQLAPIDRTEKSNSTTTYLQNLPIALIDTAGEEKREEERLDIFLKNMFLPELVGIINVVSFGHHDLGANIQATEAGKIEQGFWGKQLIREVTFLQEWLPQVKRSSARWIITLVNKMDIWKHQMTDVYDQYTNKVKPYAYEFKRVFEQGHFERPHKVLPYSSAMELFYDLPIQLSYAEHLGIQQETQAKILEFMKKY